MIRDKMKDGTTRLAGLTVQDIINVLYPVGKIHMTTDSTNPAAYFGGTWVQWGQGRVPVGYDTTDVDFDTVEKVAGEKAHILTAAEMPQHYHNLTGDINLTTGTTASGGSGENGGLSVTQGPTGGRFGHPVSLGSTKSSTTAGSNASHNNLQPYIVCYMWKRTA